MRVEAETTPTPVLVSEALRTGGALVGVLDPRLLDPSSRESRQDEEDEKKVPKRRTRGRPPAAKCSPHRHQHLPPLAAGCWLFPHRKACSGVTHIISRM